ncbi:hypothetical protein F53441_12238 [Fusarium austroafricanum]|uniref:Uncharacterized protein n=1 Tax=Fusarium austroafricanum TaxID=2364996 RepID=A0A8H4JX32_9HYPO|nr:hypothetical protein F53441_12238 [Fusarium austroafricanum]
MEHGRRRTRHIAANLEHNSHGDVTLHTHVEDQPAQPDLTDKTLDEIYPADDLPEMVDVGLQDNLKRPDECCIEGIKNEDVWLLIRRFNKRVFHLKHVPNHPEDELDFNVAQEEQFSPNKLRAQLERLYMGAILGCIIFRQHLSRLQSWREPRRTTAFCLVYFTAWYLDFLIPTLLAALMAILLSPKIRNTLFPPCPPSLVHYQGGHLIKPASGILGTVDSATGAPENLKGETLEREASNFATGIIALSINTFVDKDPQHDESQRGGGKTANLPDPRSLATRIATAKDKAGGVDNPSWDKSKSPMQELMWSQMRPLMHWICRFCDIWERSAKITFKNIPTDSQLTITLLRQGERNKAPLPPPPISTGPPPDDLHPLNDNILAATNGDLPLGASQKEIQEAIQEDTGIIQNTGGDDNEYPEHNTGRKKRGKVLGIIKPIALAAAKTVIGVDKVRAKAGTRSAKNRVGAASPREKPPIAGPVEFTCRWQGEKGFVYLTTDNASPCLCFSTRAVGVTEAQPTWIIPVQEITTLNKYSGYGAKAKLLAGWALEDEITDGLEIFELEENDLVVAHIGGRRFSMDFKLRMADIIHDSYEWINLHTCANPKCMAEGRRVPFFHNDCCDFRLYDILDALVAAGDYTFEPPGHENNRRSQRIKRLLALKLRDELQIRLPAEILTAIAGLLVRECAAITAEEQSLGSISLIILP